MDETPEPIRAAAQRYLYLAQQFRAGAGNPPNLRRWSGRVFFPPHAGIMELPDAIVLSGEWFVIKDDTIFCDGFVQTPLPPHSAYLIGFDAGDAGVQVLAQAPLGLPVERAFLLGNCGNYTHWLLDYLPRMQLCLDASLPLLMSRPVTAFQRESLALLGVDPGRFLTLDYPNAYLVKRLVYPCLNSSIVMPPLSFRPEIVDWLRHSFLPAAPVRHGGRKLFISRAGGADARSRRLLNHDAVIATARDAGFEIVRSETLSFAEQVALFAEASVIAGPHGSGFANMVFAPPQTHVIEMIGPRYAQDTIGGSMPYQRLARLLDQRLTRLVGQPDPEAAAALDHLAQETFTIDPAAFAAALPG